MGLLGGIFGKLLGGASPDDNESKDRDYVNDDSDDDTIFDDIEDDDDYDGVPEGCAACGGPYPHCKDSCPLFDDD